MVKKNTKKAIQAKFTLVNFAEFSTKHILGYIFGLLANDFPACKTFQKQLKNFLGHQFLKTNYLKSLPAT